MKAARMAIANAAVNSARLFNIGGITNDS
jgi:hypothetical protein